MGTPEGVLEVSPMSVGADGTVAAREDGAPVDATERSSEAGVVEDMATKAGASRSRDS
jgi:hypothetical protein